MNFEKQMPEKGQKKNRLEGIVRKVEDIGDLQGLGIDEKIKGAIVALMAHGFNTTNSCGGHCDHGVDMPFVDIGAEGEPKYAYEQEEALYHEVASEHGVDLDNLDLQHSESDLKIYTQIQREVGEKLNKLLEAKKLKETQERIKWEEKNKELFNSLKDLVKEFYVLKGADYKKDQDRVMLEGDGTAEFRLRTYSGYDRFVDSLTRENKFDGLDDDSKKRELAKLAIRQEKMKEFAKFLIERFLNS